MAELTDKERSQMEEGRRAQVTFSFLNPILDSQKQEVVSKMMSAYRSGECEQLKLLAFVAELCTIEDIANKLKSKINTAETIAKKGNEQ